jgi:hypothetical protein
VPHHFFFFVLSWPQALNLLSGHYTFTLEQEFKLNDLKARLHLNLGAVYLKGKPEPRKAIEHCEKVPYLFCIMEIYLYPFFEFSLCCVYLIMRERERERELS